MRRTGGARRGDGPEVVVVVGAGGGVGASTLAALIAQRRAGSSRTRQGSPGSVVLVDLDQARGGVEVLLGIEAERGARWSDVAHVRGTLGPGDLDGVLPRWRGVDVLSAGRGTRADAQAVAAVSVALVERYDTVVVDVPAHVLLADVGGADGPASLLLGARTDLLLVAGQDVRGVANALAVRPALDGGPSRLVLRRRRGARVAPLEAAHLLDLALLAMLPADRRVADATERGLGPVVGRWSPMARAVGRVADGLCGGSG